MKLRKNYFFVELILSQLIIAAFPNPLAFDCGHTKRIVWGSGPEYTPT